MKLDEIARRTMALLPGRSASRLFGLVREESALSPEVLGDLRLAEIQRQAEAMARERPIRLVAIGLIAAVFLVYLPVWLVLIAATAVLLADGLEQRMMAGVLRGKGLGRDYRLGLLAVYVGEVGFCLPAALIWHMDDGFTKAISVGVFSAAMMRLATVRSIDPATGFAGAAALGCLILVSNSWYWIAVGQPQGLLFTTLIAVVSVGYLVAAILQNHRQQRLAALSQMSALRASEAKSRFLAQMSHELRTPLNAIIGTGTAIILTTGDARIREQMAVLLESAEGLAVVLNDVLDLSAMEEGRIPLRPRPGDLAQEVGRCVALFRSQAVAAGVDLVLEVQGDLPPVLRLDYDRLRQCLSNLLSNALKHTEQGHIRVRLGFAAPGQIEIEVQDTGAGIPPGEEERIFQRYERGAATREGHGLGLAICRMLVERMGGRIGMRPSERGANFYLILPVEVVPGGSVPVDPGLGVQDLAGLRVLVVDDIATNRLVAATYLGLLAARVIEVASGAAAIEVARTGQDVDVVLLDMNMPGVSGLETLRQIRALPGEAGRLPVIAMTADAEDRDRQAYLAAGLDGYVSKPIHLNALRAEIVRVLAGRPGNVRQSDT